MKFEGYTIEQDIFDRWVVKEVNGTIVYVANSLGAAKHWCLKF